MWRQSTALFDEFIAEMRRHGAVPEGEVRRFEAVWPEAERAALRCLAEMPGIGMLSPAQRERAFLVVADNLDGEMAEGEITEEQGQLALTILRMSSGRYRKAEAGFLARRGRRDAECQEKLPQTARILLHSLEVLRNRGS